MSRSVPAGFARRGAAGLPRGGAAGLARVAAAAVALLVAACDRPFVPVRPPSIEVLSPDPGVVQTDSLVTIRLRATSFRDVGFVEIDGTALAGLGDGLFEGTVGLAPGENRLVARAFDTEDVPGVDTLRFLRLRLRVTAGPAWPDAVGAFALHRLPDGSVLITGGAPGEHEDADNRVRRFDPETGLVETVASMVTARAGHAMTLLPDGRILVTGGSALGRTRSVADLVEQAERFDPAGLTSIPIRVLGDPIRRYAHTAALRARAGGIALDLVGGWGDVEYRPEPRFGVREDLRSFMVEGDSLVAVHPAPGPYLDPLAGHSQTPLAEFRPGVGGRFLVTGAVFAPGGVYARTLVLDTQHPAGIDVIDLANPDPPRSEHVALRTPAGHVLLLGGRTPSDASPEGEVVPGAAIYVPSFGRFVRFDAGDLEYLRPRRLFGATFLADGRILVLGGYTRDGTTDRSVEYLTLY